MTQVDIMYIMYYHCFVMKNQKLTQPSIMLSVAETRKNIGTLLEDVYHNNTKYIISRRGKPYAEVTRVSSTSMGKAKASTMDDLLLTAAKIRKTVPRSLTLHDILKDIRS